MGPQASDDLFFLRQQSLDIDGETGSHNLCLSLQENQQADMTTFKSRFDKLVTPTMTSITDCTKPDAKYIEAISFVLSCRMMLAVCKSAAEKIKAIFTAMHEDITLCRPMFVVCTTSMDRCALCVENGKPYVRMCGVSVEVPGTTGVNNGPYRREGKTFVPGIWWTTGGVVGTEQIRGGVACPCDVHMKLAKFRQGDSTKVIVTMCSDQAASALYHGKDIAHLDRKDRFSLVTNSSMWETDGQISVVLPNDDNAEKQLENFEDLLRSVCITQVGKDPEFRILKVLNDRNWENNVLTPDMQGYSAHFRTDAPEQTVNALCEYSNGMEAKLKVLDAWALRSEIWSDQDNFIEHLQQKNMSGLRVQYEEGKRGAYSVNRRARNRRSRGDGATGFETREYIKGLGRNAPLVMAAIVRERERIGPNSRDFLEGRMLKVEKDEQTVFAREGEIRARLQALEKCDRAVSDLEKHYTRLATDAKAGKVLLTAATTAFAGFKRTREIS